VRAFVLDAGKTYELTLAHHQPFDVQQTDRFSVLVDDGILRLVRSDSFEISSRYDIITIPFYAVESDKYEHRDTVIATEPEPGKQAPRLRLPVRVQAPKGRAVKAVTGSALALFLLALPGLWDSLALPLKLIASLLGAGGAAYLAVFGLKRS
jgi:hypothetical protein